MTIFVLKVSLRLKSVSDYLKLELESQHSIDCLSGHCLMPAS